MCTWWVRGRDGRRGEGWAVGAVWCPGQGLHDLFELEDVSACEKFQSVAA